MLPWAKIFHPSLVVRQWIRKQPDWSLQTKLDLDWFPYPHYAYCLNAASIQAKRLGIERISAIEVGIAAGDGLTAMETISAELTKEHGVAIDLYGIDTVEPSSPSTDPRDLPYARQATETRVDRAALDAKLKRTTLILGDPRQTVASFIETFTPAPIGFISFASGDYTATVNAFRLFDAPADTRLPRTFTTFENTVGTDDELHSEHTGQLLAIAEFNRASETKKLGQINGLRHKRVFHAAWNDQVYVLHDMAHPSYGRYTGSDPATPTK